MDGAKVEGFRFERIAEGPDAPVVGVRDSVGYRDEIYLAGFSDSCTAIRRKRFSLIVPGGLPVIERVSGDALTVLRKAVCEWTV
jgi:hypothetical protein